jgi:putative ABC transport system permease protein
VLLQDIRYAVRTLIKNRGFTAVAVACLALGIGVNATVFSLFDGVVLQPYPYPDATRMVVFRSVNPRLHISRGALPFLDYRDIRDSTKSFAALEAFDYRSVTIDDRSGEPERYRGSAISHGLFDLLGAAPVLGRSFRAEDDRPGAEPVVLLSDDVWARRYNRDPSVVGRAINVSGHLATVIGVMPPRFAFPETQQLWLPLSMYSGAMLRNQRGLQVFGRLRPGVSIDQAQSEAAAVASRLAATYPKEDEDWSVAVHPLREWMLPKQVELMLFTMMGAVMLVLLIACSNVANLLLARASVRHREISIRSALGAGQWRIVRQLLTESLLIGLISAPLGILLAWVGIHLLDRAMPVDAVPYFIHWSLDGRSLAYTVGISLVTGIVFGLAPALQAARPNLQDSLKEGGRGAAGGQRARLRNGLVIVEVALSLVLLVGASMFMRSFINLQTASLGFETAPLMTMRFFMTGAKYESAEARAQRVEDVVRRVEALPGVQAAFASNFMPLGDGGGDNAVVVEGKPVERGKEQRIAFVGTSPHLRQTLGVALLRGRDFTEAENTARAPVALINHSMAQRLWGDDDPIGRRFSRTADSAPEWLTVVGVAADFSHNQPNVDEPNFPAAYAPYGFDAASSTGLTIRAAGRPERITSAVREQIRASDASLPIFQVMTMEELKALSFWQDRLFGAMFSVFGAVALILAAIGVYGMLSYSVSQRTQEIGVRMALGANPRDVLQLVIVHGLKLAGIGVVFGIGGAIAAARQIQSVLYNVTPTDPLSLIGVSLFLTLTALVASYVPARRAMAVDPLVALRRE